MGLCNDHFVIDPLSPRKSIGRYLPPNPLMMLMKSQSLFIHIYVSIMYYILYCVNWQRCIFWDVLVEGCLLCLVIEGKAKKKGQKESTGVLGLCKGKLQKYFSAKKMG